LVAVRHTIVQVSMLLHNARIGWPGMHMAQSVIMCEYTKKKLKVIKIINTKENCISVTDNDCDTLYNRPVHLSECTLHDRQNQKYLLYSKYVAMNPKKGARRQDGLTVSRNITLTLCSTHFTLKMEAEKSSESSLSYHISTLCHNPEELDFKFLLLLERLWSE
jgi:hypothetical protein